MDDWYAKLVRRMTTPSFVIDNDACPDATIMKLLRVEEMNKQGILLGVVQILADLNLVIIKANMSFDGEWFMDVFHVTDSEGKKVLDPEIITTIEQSVFSHSPQPAPDQTLTCIELTGVDRPGLLSELCAVLRDTGLNVVNGELWTHNSRAAAVILISGDFSGGLPAKLAAVNALLCNIQISSNTTHRDRRLHQLMTSDGDKFSALEEDFCDVHVSISSCTEKDYTVVNVRSKDRPKLLFDTLCALADMNYLVFHGTVLPRGNAEAWQEFYVRHEDGTGLRSEEERRFAERSLAAAIARRAADGVVVELQTEDRVGLLSDITRVFRENGLSIRRAQISTVSGRAVDFFHVSDSSGGRVDPTRVDFACRQISQLGKAVVRVRGESHRPKVDESSGFLLGNILRACSFNSFRPIKLNS